MGSSSPATGTGTGGTVFTPPNQGTAAFNFGNILEPFIQSSFTAANNLAGFNGGGFPESYVVPNAFNATQNIVNNPYAGGALQSALDAQGIISGSAIPGANAGANYLQDLGNIATFPADQVVNQTINNPAYGQAAGYGAQLAPQYMNFGQTIAPQMLAAGQQASAPMLAAQQQLLNQGFDPQQALYNQERQLSLENANVAGAMAGTGNTPYGASVNANALNNFDLNWQNNLQQRGIAGANAAGQAGATGVSDLVTGGAAGLNALTTGGQAAQSALLNPANAQSAATLQGTSALGNLANTAQGAFSGANALRTGNAANLAQYGQLPYQTYQGQQGNNLSALANLTSLANQQYQLPQQTLQDLESYLGLGQSASTIANQIGATNFNEQLQGLSGVGSGIGAANSLLGNPLSSVGSSLFGAGAASAPLLSPGVGGAFATAPFTDLAATGGASAASSFAPLAFLGS
jgi:hypothetical protein